MTELLLDAGVWVASADVEDENHAAAARLVESAARGDAELAALDLTLYEVANVAVVKWRSATGAAEIVRLVRVACGEALQRVDEELAREASIFALEHGITAYDAAYVVAARRRGAQLVSGDLADLVRPGFAVTPEQAAGV